MRVYTGPAIEKGDTCIKAEVTPGVKYLYEKGFFKSPVVDWGCGKHVRNANWLRAKGLKVYAYDPNYDTGSGYGGISNVEPTDRFETGFSSYVLNVVRLEDEEYIIHKLLELCAESYHIIRTDVLAQVKKWLEKNNVTATKWFKTEFATKKEIKLLDKGELPDELIEEFARYGVKTSRGRGRYGFQRHCKLDLPLILKTNNFSIFKGAQ